MSNESGSRETYPARHRWLDAVHGCSHLSPKTKNIAWALYKHADKESLRCWPNLDTLDKDLGGKGSSKNVARHIQALRLARFIEVRKERHGGHLSSNYRLIDPGSDWTCSVAHRDPEATDLYLKKTSLDTEQTGLDDEQADHEGDGLTLSRTPSITLSKNTINDSFRDQPAADLSIQEEDQEDLDSEGGLSLTPYSDCALLDSLEDNEQDPDHQDDGQEAWPGDSHDADLSEIIREQDAIHDAISDSWWKQTIARGPEDDYPEDSATDRAMTPGQRKAEIKSLGNRYFISDTFASDSVSATVPVPEPTRW